MDEIKPELVIEVCIPLLLWCQGTKFTIPTGGTIMVNAVEANLGDLKDRNYVRRADPKVGYWFSFYVRKMQTMTLRFGNDFFLIVHGAQDRDNDYFVIPYERVKDVFIDENTTGINSKAKDAKTRTPRWSGNIVNNRLHVTHSDQRIDLTRYYGNRTLLEEAMGRFGDKALNSPQLDADAEIGRAHV